VLTRTLRLGSAGPTRIDHDARFERRADRAPESTLGSRSRRRLDYTARLEDYKQALAISGLSTMDKLFDRIAQQPTSSQIQPRSMSFQLA